MIPIPKKVSERFMKEVGRFQGILKNAKDRDVNEADTVTIVTDILADVFGFDKYTEVTSEFCIRGTYCDLAIKINNSVKYLIEVKAIGLDLKSHHLQQALNYGANQGIHWIVLTNGLQWEIHRIAFEKPIRAEKVCSFDFISLNPRKQEDHEKLYLLCKEGLNKAAIEDFHERAQTVSRFTVGAILLSSLVKGIIRKEMKRLAPGLQVEEKEIEAILRNEVIKRDAVEGDDAQKAMAKVKKVARVGKKPAKKEAEPVAEAV